MRERVIVKIIAGIETTIGLGTLIGLMLSSSLFPTEKTTSIFIFVFCTSIVSIVLGVGLLNGRDWARKALIYFSGYVLMTKILSFFGIVHFLGELFVLIPSEMKDIISFLYHNCIILFLMAPETKKEFNR